MHYHFGRHLLVSVVLAALAQAVCATPDYVLHDPLRGVYGESAAVTMREPDAPREAEALQIWISIGYSFYYDRVAIYYTDDGAEPQGSFGSPQNASTRVLGSAEGSITFIRNEPHSPNIDWWRAQLPGDYPLREYGTTVRYRIGAWDSGGGPEVFANNTGCADGTCDDPSGAPATFAYTVKLAWPGRGVPNASPDAGYPNVHFWKEEAVTGNNWMNVMLDQNGSIYDIYYPSAGCVQGMGTRNEGYADGLDTFPPFTSGRGQMNMNIGALGIRVDGSTYWMTNEQAAGYSDVSQAYVPGTNVIRTSQTLTGGANNIRVDQYDFCPKGLTYPSSLDGQPVRGMHIKRAVITNNGAAPKTLDLYYYGDQALNGGDGYDAMFFDAARGAMGSYDDVYRTTSESGEYNPTFFGSYTKNVSLYLAAALKLCSSVGVSSGSVATDSWRDSSPDNGQGWIGLRLVLQPGESRELDLALIGAFRATAAAQPSPYEKDIVPALEWFYSGSMASAQAATESYWAGWLGSGTTAEFPDQRYTELFRRSLLATALHYDEKGGGIVAGMHNGAYPFVWPRDAVYAAVTLDRTGHHAEAADVYRFLSATAYRADEEPGRKGWWYQKYTTDGYAVWTAPQVDETAVVPWGVRYHYLATGEEPFLAGNYQMVYEAALASSQDSNISSQLFYDDANKLMHSNNVWEDSYDDFLYSNASVERGLRDAALIAARLRRGDDAALFASRADAIHEGILGRLAWDGENTDISQLGLTYPFECLAADSLQMRHLVDRMTGAAADRYGNVHPILNSAGEFAGLVNRYWGDSYWNGGPWFLTTLWFGQHHALLQNTAPGKADIDVLKNKLDLLIARLGPAGLGAEQIAPLNSLLYPGQPDFSLQAAWPNAWESMSTMVDALMLFLDFRPIAPGNRCELRPKLPTGWGEMTFRNVRFGGNAFDITCSEDAYESRQTFRNVAGAVFQVDTVIRIPAGSTVLAVLRNGVSTAYALDAATGGVSVTMDLQTGVGAETRLSVFYCQGCAEATIASAKSVPEGSEVHLSGVAVTRQHDGRFYVESPDRSSGIAVIGTGAARGEFIQMVGTAGLSGPERVIALGAILAQTPGTAPEPVRMSGRTAGGADFGDQAGVISGAGLNNVGLDVTLFGVIRHIQDDGSCLVVDDGSGRVSATGHPGVRVTGNLDTGRFTVGQFVSVTGSLSIEAGPGGNVALLRVASASDVSW
jgi:hypothetical protein